MSDLYPYVLEPKLTEAIWGGDALVTTYHKPGDATVKLGESWECWDENRVANGTLAGMTLGDVRARLGAKLLGAGDATRLFPLLTKLIDARDALSVQVHPDDAYAQRVEHQPNGKTECWYVLSAAPKAEIVLGWSRDTNRAEYERRVADGTLGELLRKVPVETGDVFYLPAGTLHAIGAGIELFEAQQASDLTYRIFDWNRVGVDGKPRELHVAKAGDVLDYRRMLTGAADTLEYAYEGLERTLLIGSPNFTVERIDADTQGGSFAIDDSPAIVMALYTPLAIVAGGVTVELEPWTTAVVPAALPEVTIEGDGSALVVAPPADTALIRARLEAAGVARSDADAFFAQFA